ncbi:MAG: hypothetical protein ACUVSF_10340 [Anaerolineae bacterium]
MSAKATQAEEKEFDLEEWLREGIQGLRRSLRCRPPALPEKFKMHTRAARKEMLLAVRSLLDSAICELEETPEPAAKKQ